MNSGHPTNGTLTKGWVLALVLPILFGLLIWVGKGLAADLRAEASINIQQERRLDRHELRIEAQDGALREINRKLDLLLETVPRNPSRGGRE